MATEKDLINVSVDKNCYKIPLQHNLQNKSTTLVQIGNSLKIENEFMEKSKGVKRKKLRDTGEGYISQKGVPIPTASPPSEIQICKCSHQCHKLTIEDKLTIFNSYNQKSYEEQSEYIVYYCMSLIEPKRRKIDKAISQRQATFLYQLQLGPKIVSVCQKTLCSVLGVTARRIQVLQNKMKKARNEIDLTDKRGKHCNRPHKTSENTVRKIQEHICSFPRYESHFFKETLVKSPFNPAGLTNQLSVTKIYQLFCEKHPEIQVSRKLFNCIWRKTLSSFNEADVSEDLDDPINDRLNYQNNFSVETYEGETVRDSLDADGQLGRMKAEMRTEVMKLLDGSSKSSKVKRPKSPHDVLLLNELIREYLDWIGYKYTSNVLVAECELGKQPLNRSFLALDLGVKETEKSQSLPLLFCLIETFKELKAASISSC